MNFSEFHARFKKTERGGINVGFNWTRMEDEEWTISTSSTKSQSELGKLYIPRYVAEGVELVGYKDQGARPLTVEEAAKSLQGWPRLSSDIITGYISDFNRCSPPIKCVFPAYRISDDEKLLLDGTHRAIALFQSNLDFELCLATVQGPICEDALSDMHYWVSEKR